MVKGHLTSCGLPGSSLVSLLFNRKNPLLLNYFFYIMFKSNHIHSNLYIVDESSRNTKQVSDIISDVYSVDVLILYRGKYSWGNILVHFPQRTTALALLWI